MSVGERAQVEDSAHVLNCHCEPGQQKSGSTNIFEQTSLTPETQRITVKTSPEFCILNV